MPIVCCMCKNLLVKSELFCSVDFCSDMQVYLTVCVETSEAGKRHLFEFPPWTVINTTFGNAMGFRICVPQRTCRM